MASQLSGNEVVLCYAAALEQSVRKHRSAFLSKITTIVMRLLVVCEAPKVIHKESRREKETNFGSGLIFFFLRT